MLQLTSQRRYDQPLDEYYAKIERKTAVLLAASTYCGAVLGGLDDGQVEAMRRFGHQLGMSFQIADDVLDVVADKKKLGKSGSDVKNQKLTFPAVYGLEESRRKARTLIEEAKHALEMFGIDRPEEDHLGLLGTRVPFDPGQRPLGVLRPVQGQQDFFQHDRLRRSGAQKSKGDAIATDAGSKVEWALRPTVRRHFPVLWGEFG